MGYLTSVMRGQSEADVVVVEGTGDGYSEAKLIKKPPDEKERLGGGGTSANGTGFLRNACRLKAIRR